MRLIYTKDGFTKNEKEEWRVIIFNNILDGLRMTMGAMKEFGINFEYESNKVSKSILEKYDPCAMLTTDTSVAGSPANY